MSRGRGRPKVRFSDNIQEFGRSQSFLGVYRPLMDDDVKGHGNIECFRFQKWIHAHLHTKVASTDGAYLLF